MPRVDLQVPYADKDHAKKLGARWDAAKKVWYIPDGIASDEFSRWLPAESEWKIRSTSYFIAENVVSCWKCGDRTRVFGLLLPSGCEAFEAVDPADVGFGDDDEYDDKVLQEWLASAESSEWVEIDEPTFLFYIQDLSNSVAEKIRGHTRNFRIDFSKTTQSSYWMNHCEQCGMKQGDFEMHCEPQGAFLPLYEKDAAGIILTQINEPFHAGPCSYGGSLDHFEHMQIRN